MDDYCVKCDRVQPVRAVSCPTMTSYHCEVCGTQTDADYDFGDYGEPNNEPIGSCDECGTNLYEDDEYNGMCGQCYWFIYMAGGE